MGCGANFEDAIKTFFTAWNHIAAPRNLPTAHNNTHKVHFLLALCAVLFFGCAPVLADWAWNIKSENDLYNFGDHLGIKNYDRYYTAGEAFNLSDGVDTFGIENVMHTPDDIRSHNIQYGDCPCSGAMLVDYLRTVSLLPASRSQVGVTVGWSGYYSMAESFQEFIHHNLGRGANPYCWNHQLGADVLFDFTAIHEQRLLRIADCGLRNIGVELWENSRADVGDLYTRWQTGPELRMGWNLPDQTTQPMPLTLPLTECQPWRCYLTCGALFSDVGYDYYFQGAPWRTDPNLTGVHVEHYVTDLIGGVHVQSPSGWGAAYLYDARSKEFQEQGGWHGFGSITVGKGWEF